MSRVVVTPQLMTAIFQGYKTLFQKGWEGAETFFEDIVTQTTSNTSKEVYGWLGQTTGFREWLGDRVIQALTSHDFSIANRHFENTVSVSRNQIEDDEYGTLGMAFEQLGQDAREHPDQVVFELLQNGQTVKCYDGQPFFSAAHPTTDSKGKVFTQANLLTEAGGKPFWYVFDVSRVIKPVIWQSRKKAEFIRKDRGDQSDIVFTNNQAVYGADYRANAGFGLWQFAVACNKDLTPANFKAVRQLMRQLKGDNGRPLRVKPTLIHVPPSLEAAAETIFAKALISGGETNELYNAVKWRVNTYLQG